MFFAGPNGESPIVPGNTCLVLRSVLFWFGVHNWTETAPQEPAFCRNEPRSGHRDVAVGLLDCPILDRRGLNPFVLFHNLIASAFVTATIQKLLRI
jgi:hypothetical protein